MSRAMTIGRRTVRPPGRLLERGRPVMFGWTEQMKVYVAGRQRRDVVGPHLDAREDVADEDAAPPAAPWISMLWGVPGSLLWKPIVNG